MTYIKQKIPWLKILVIVMLVAFVIVGLSFIPGVGAMMIGAIVGGVLGIYAFFFISPTWLSVVIAAAVVGGIIILFAYRKYFFKQKISSMPITTAQPTLQGGLINTNPLVTPVPQQIIANANEKTEVSS